MGNKDIRERLCAALDITPDVLPHGTLVEIRDRGYVHISGCERILNYTQSLIRVSLRDGAIAVSGERLLCSSFCRGELGIEGKILGVCFEEEI